MVGVVSTDITLPLSADHFLTVLLLSSSPPCTTACPLLFVFLTVMVSPLTIKLALSPPCSSEDSA